MSLLMPPPSPRLVPKAKKRWCTSEESADRNDHKFTLTTPRRDHVAKSPDHPPMSVVVIQSNSTNDSPWVEISNEEVSLPEPPTTFGSSPWANVSKLMPRNPLPVCCVSPTPSGDRKRRASSIASSSVEESISYYSPSKPRRQILPEKKADRSCFIHRKTPSDESISHNVMKMQKHQDSTPTKMTVDFSLENLSLQSPVARKPRDHPSVLGNTPPSTAQPTERGKSFSEYIASPARSLHSSFSDYVPSPAIRRPRARTFDSTSQASIARSTPPRKVRLKVLSQQARPRNQHMETPFIFTRTPDTEKLPPVRYERTSSLLYSPDEDDEGSCDEFRNKHRPSLLTSRPPLAVQIGLNDVTMTPKSSATDPLPNSYNSSPPRRPRPTISLLTPRTPLPRISLTPKKSKGRVDMIGLRPKLSGSSKRPAPRRSRIETAPGSLDDAKKTPLSSFSKTPPNGIYPVSPRLLFPPAGSSLLQEDPSAAASANDTVDKLLNKSIETQSFHSNNMSCYLSDSDDEDDFVLASPAAIKQEAAWLKKQSSDSSIRLAKQARY